MRRTKRGLMITGLFSGLFLTGCFGSEPDPTETLQTFIDQWNEQNYEEMYAMLSEASIEETQAEFVERIGNLYESMQLNTIQVEATFPEDDENSDIPEGEYSAPLSVSISNSLGDVEFDQDIQLQLEELEDGDQWSVVWEDALVYPAYENGDRFNVTNSVPVRGELFDRNGNGLAVNGNIVNIGTVPERIEDREEFIEDFSDMTGVSRETIEARLDQSWVTDGAFVPIHSVPITELEWAEEELRSITGATYQMADGREYPYGATTGHLTGFLRDITAEQLEEYEELGYNSYDKIGQAGLESVFEERLRGKVGGALRLIDQGDEVKETLLETEPEAGEDITLTIDVELQEEIFNELGEDAGTATAMHPTNGQVLALVNQPSYDPNLRAAGFTSRQQQDIEANEDDPLTNRFSQTFSPGSTFKLLTAAIGLEAGTLDPAETIDVDGYSWQPEGAGWGGYSVTRVHDYGEPVDLRKALVYSDNIYFADQALNLGEDAFTEGAEAFGFGEELPLPELFNISTLTGEEGFRNDIQLADSGYGQGEIQMNPLHLGLTFTTIVNDGSIVKPLLELDEQEGIWKEGVMSAEHAELLQQDLIDVLEDSRGTATQAAVEGVRIAGKTGTAELKLSQEDDGKEHGWFVAVNVDDPDFLLVMMVDDVSDKGGSGYVVDKAAEILQSNVN
ncbi:penicillin-binding transpeptidase domain-containing protein [Alkalicoccobacillus porphyridii]|nr:penicillin-binding transpeptidase domain-containing protein [Alkalicoccobacillus porphyridii]